MPDEIKNIQNAASGTAIGLQGSIESRILNIRGKQVMLDRDLAELYGVETKALNQAVKRNAKRFPEDFMFQLTKEESRDFLSGITSQTDVSNQDNIYGQLETDTSRSQIVTMNNMGRGKNIKYRPYAFTEQGVAMLSGILRSDTAIEVNIRIMRAFVAMRRFLLANAQVFQRIETLEMRQITTDNKLNLVLSKLDDGTASKIEGIFYEGEVFSARVFIEDLIKSAQREIILIDAYLKDLGKRLFAFTRMEIDKSIITAQL